MKIVPKNPEIQKEKEELNLQHKLKITEEEAWVICKQLLEALNYLNSQGIVHRDIKPANILLKDKNSLDDIRLADFGLSEALPTFEGHKLKKNFSSKCGTILYMAPEYFTKDSFTNAVDIWALGIILFKMLSEDLTHPFYYENS